MKKVVLVVLLLLILLAGGLYLQRNRSVNPQAQEEAIRQAQEYSTDKICTMALVPAVHKATGAKYTFSNGCLAPGWEPER
jgi:Flp pilus assembly protein CpaB